jgi:hypothetical protein
LSNAFASDALGQANLFEGPRIALYSISQLQQTPFSRLQTLDGGANSLNPLSLKHPVKGLVVGWSRHGSRLGVFGLVTIGQGPNVEGTLDRQPLAEEAFVLQAETRQFVFRWTRAECRAQSLEVASDRKERGDDMDRQSNEQRRVGTQPQTCLSYSVSCIGGKLVTTIGIESSGRLNQPNHADLLGVIRIQAVQSLQLFREISREGPMQENELAEGVGVTVGHRHGELVAAHGVPVASGEQLLVWRHVERRADAMKGIDERDVGFLVERESKGAQSLEKRDGWRVASEDGVANRQW